MIKNLLKKALPMFFGLFLVFNVAAVANTNANQGGSDAILWDNKVDKIKANTGLGNDDPRNIVANIINIALGFLGILSLVLILYAGFKWMTAAGNETQAGDAKKILISAVIGLIIILSAFAISSFVLDAVYRAATDGR